MKSMSTRAKCTGCLELGEVAGAVEDLQAAARHAPMGDRGVLDGDEWIPAAPDDQRGDHLCQVQPVGGVHPLTGESMTARSVCRNARRASASLREA